MNDIQNSIDSNCWSNKDSTITELKHQTIMLNTAVEKLVTNLDGIYVDGTFGRGGHSRLLLSKPSFNGRVIGIDKDPTAIAEGRKLALENSNFVIHHGSFADIHQILPGTLIDGILLDLGMSSPQVDDPNRGFSFSHDGYLDMRMNNQQGESAAQWLARAQEQEISRVLWEYGEERFSRRIARAIVAARALEPILTTRQLVNIIISACPVREKGKHPCTRSFQAIRIHINQELDDLAVCLDRVLDKLKPCGRLVVISFHSLEDRIVKRFIRKHQKGDYLPSWLPVTEDKLNCKMRSLGKPLKPLAEEIAANPRARSALLRVAERLN